MAFTCRDGRRRRGRRAPGARGRRTARSASARQNAQPITNTRATESGNEEVEAFHGGSAPSGRSALSEHGERARAHGERGFPGTDQARGGERQRERVVGERPGDVLAHEAHRAPGDAARVREMLSSESPMQHHVGPELRRVGAAAHGEGDVRARQHRRVVQAVADHRHDAALRAADARGSGTCPAGVIAAGAMLDAELARERADHFRLGHRWQGARPRPARLELATTSAGAAGRSSSASSKAASQPVSSARIHAASKCGSGLSAAASAHSRLQNALVADAHAAARRPRLDALARERCAAPAPRSRVRRRRRAPPDGGSTASRARASSQAALRHARAKRSALRDAQCGRSSACRSCRARRRSRARALRARRARVSSTPCASSAPLARVSTIGAASASAHGQATTSTAIATQGFAEYSTGRAAASTHDPGQVRARRAPPPRPARGLDAAPRSARRAIAAARVSAPVRVTRMASGCSRFTEPPTSSSPARLATGRDSPVSSDSSALEAPSSTTPSAGMRSPGAIGDLAWSENVPCVSPFAAADRARARRGGAPPARGSARRGAGKRAC